MNLITDCIDFVNSFNYTLNELKFYKFKYNNNIYDFNEFVKRYQTELSNIKFMKKLFKLGFEFTPDYFYYYCNYACDILLIDWYIDNIIDIYNINYKLLNIDNHQIIKKIISRGYNRDTIDELCFVPFINTISICVCYYELIKHNYTFNNNYILQTVFDMALDNRFNKLLKHQIFKDYQNNQDKYKVTEKDLQECHIKFHQQMEIMLYNINTEYPLNLLTEGHKNKKLI